MNGWFATVLIVAMLCITLVALVVLAPKRRP